MAFKLKPLAAATKDNPLPIASHTDSRTLAQRWEQANPEQRLLLSHHALNRLAYGRSPKDVENILATGLPAWLKQQLQATTPAPALEHAATLHQYSRLLAA